MTGVRVVLCVLVLLAATTRAGAAESQKPGEPSHPVSVVHGGAKRQDVATASRETVERLAALGYAEWTEVELTGVVGEAGVVFHDPEKAFESLNLFKSRPAREAHLMDMRGRLLHTWRQPKAQEVSWDFVELAPDGSLYGSAKYESLVKLDWDSNVEWLRPIRPHHDLAVAEDGRVYALTQTEGERARDGKSYLIRDNEITVLSPDGEVEQSVSLWDLFGDQVSEKRLQRIDRHREEGFHGDVFHANSIEILNRNVAGVGRKGDLLVSIRELDTIAVIDLDGPRVTWQWGEGVLDRQHHASLLPSGRILVFDNGKTRGWSRVLELHPRDRRVTWELKGDPAESLFTGARGSTELLPNGNVMVVESAKGRVFEVTRAGEVVWDFYNPNIQKKAGKQRRAAVYRSPRLDPSLVETLPLTPSGPLRSAVSDDLWKAANRGRVPFGADGSFAFPSTVERVVVDVGAYKLRRTRHFLREDPGVGIVAVEPLSEPWAEWPKSRRVIGVPAAVSLSRGELEFNVNEKDVTSSLLDTTDGSLLSTETVEVRRVPGVRLEDVLERIPSELPIIFLKTDVQGMDLAVLMSAGEQLRRVREVHSEIINDPSYEPDGLGSMSSEEEFTDYMASMGFSVAKEIPAPERWIVDVFYQNDSWVEASSESPDPS